jgi:hypothetical protein
VATLPRSDKQQSVQAQQQLLTTVSQTRRALGGVRRELATASALGLRSRLQAMSEA